MSGRPGRPAVHSDDALARAAAEVFLARGFHDASMLDIARHAGATKPTLYARFGSKEALYDRTLERIADSLIAHMAIAYSRVRGQRAIDQTHAAAAAFFAWVKANPVGFRLLLGTDRGAPTGTDHGQRALASLTGLLVDAMTEYARRRGRQTPAAIELAAATVVGAFDYGARWAVEHDALDRLDVAAFTATFTLSGLQGLGPDLFPAAA
jgi:AcrR family transcriptional regulator